jgi:orotidine-5'-phosphate decarboxylase
MMAYAHKSIPARERLIFALDVATADEARSWIARLGDSVAFYKIGMELLTSGDYFTVLRELDSRGKKIFVDLKFLDVPATVAAAVKGLTRYPVSLCTLHASSRAMLEGAAAAKGDIRLLAVTVLTSFDQADLADLAITTPIAELVPQRARFALDCGIDGVVCSGQELSVLRAQVDHRLLTVVPGIRPTALGDDQKRTVDVAQAFASGADYIVVGRPIRQAADPRGAADAIQSSIAASVI